MFGLANPSVKACKACTQCSYLAGACHNDANQSVTRDSNSNCRSVTKETSEWSSLFRSSSCISLITDSQFRDKIRALWAWPHVHLFLFQLQANETVVTRFSWLCKPGTVAQLMARHLFAGTFAFNSLADRLQCNEPEKSIETASTLCPITGSHESFVILASAVSLSGMQATIRCRGVWSCNTSKRLIFRWSTSIQMPQLWTLVNWGVGARMLKMYIYLVCRV